MTCVLPVTIHRSSPKDSMPRRANHPAFLTRWQDNPNVWGVTTPARQACRRFRSRTRTRTIPTDSAPRVINPPKKVKPRCPGCLRYRPTMLQAHVRHVIPQVWRARPSHRTIMPTMRIHSAALVIQARLRPQVRGHQKLRQHPGLGLRQQRRRRRRCREFLPTTPPAPVPPVTRPAP